jgi:hypothetical protein
MTGANTMRNRSPGQRFQGRGITPITERYHPIARDRAKKIIRQAEADRDPFGWPRYVRYVTSDEQLAIRRYWQTQAPSCWSQNDVLRQCAK